MNGTGRRRDYRVSDRSWWGRTRPGRGRSTDGRQHSDELLLQDPLGAQHRTRARPAWPARTAGPRRVREGRDQHLHNTRKQGARARLGRRQPGVEFPAEGPVAGQALGWPDLSEPVKGDGRHTRTSNSQASYSLPAWKRPHALAKTIGSDICVGPILMPPYYRFVGSHANQLQCRRC